MGTDPGSNDTYSDLVEMTNRGKASTSMVAPLLEGRGFDILGINEIGRREGLELFARAAA
jgi:hypothetical protein